MLGSTMVWKNIFNTTSESGSGTPGTPKLKQQRDKAKRKLASSDPFFRYKLMKQFSLVAVWMCMGFYMEIVGPTLPDLRDRVGVNIEKMSRALTSTSVGVLSGSLLGGVLHERFIRHSELIISLALLLASVVTTSMPWIRKLIGIAMFLFLNGVTVGLLNTGGNTMVMHLWGDKAAPPMHSLHFGFGIGAIIVPQVAKPFLKARAATNTSQALLEPIIKNTYSNGTVNSPVGSRIEYGYLIVGALALCAAVWWMIIYLKGPPKRFPRRTGSKISRDMFSPGVCARGDMTMGGLIFATLFFFFMHSSGGVQAYGKFLFSFLVESRLRFSNVEAANLNSLFWGTFTLGRATGIPLSRFMNPSPMLTVQVGFLLLSTVAVAIFVFESKYVIWVTTVPIGYFTSQVFPSGISWANQHLDMNSVGVMVCLVGASFGGIIYQYLPGYLLNSHGKESLMYVMVMYSAALLITWIILVIMARIYLRRNPIQEENAPTDEELEMFTDFTDHGQPDVSKYNREKDSCNQQTTTVT